MLIWEFLLLFCLPFFPHLCACTTSVWLLSLSSDTEPRSQSAGFSWEEAGSTHRSWAQRTKFHLPWSVIIIPQTWLGAWYQCRPPVCVWWARFSGPKGWRCDWLITHLKLSTKLILPNLLKLRNLFINSPPSYSIHPADRGMTLVVWPVCRAGMTGLSYNDVHVCVNIANFITKFHRANFISGGWRDLW